jgi:CBS domain-containing protein
MRSPHGRRSTWSLIELLPAAIAQTNGEVAMKIDKITTHDPETIGPDAALPEAALKMKRLNVGILPVCDGNKLVGVVTDRDITIRGIAEARDPKKTKVSEVMTRKVVSCFEDQDLNEAVQLMEHHQVRRLPVLDRSNRLVGIMSLGDVAVRTQDLPVAGEILERISEPAAMLVV